MSTTKRILDRYGYVVGDFASYRNGCLEAVDTDGRIHGHCSVKELTDVECEAQNAHRREFYNTRYA